MHPAYDRRLIDYGSRLTPPKGCDDDAEDQATSRSSPARTSSA
jgi:hypothetical protein